MSSLTYLLFSGDDRTDLLCVYPLTGDILTTKATEMGKYTIVEMLQENFCTVSVNISYINF